MTQDRSGDGLGDAPPNVLGEAYPRLAATGRELPALRQALQVETGAATVRLVPGAVEVLVRIPGWMPGGVLTAIPHIALQIADATAVLEAELRTSGFSPPRSKRLTVDEQEAFASLANSLRDGSPPPVEVLFTEVVVTAFTGDGTSEEHHAEIVGPRASAPGDVIAILREVDARWLEARVVAVPYLELLFTDGAAGLAGRPVVHFLAQAHLHAVDLAGRLDPRLR